MTVSRGRCNLPGRGSSCHQEIPRIRTALSNQGIGHGYRLNRRKDTAYFDRCLELKQHRLFKEDFSSLETKPSDLRLEQLDVLSAIFQQFVDDLVDVHLLSCIHARWKSDNLNNSKINGLVTLQKKQQLNGVLINQSKSKVKKILQIIGLIQLLFRKNS